MMVKFLSLSSANRQYSNSKLRCNKSRKKIGSFNCFASAILASAFICILFASPIIFFEPWKHSKNNYKTSCILKRKSRRLSQFDLSSIDMQFDDARLTLSQYDKWIVKDCMIIPNNVSVLILLLIINEFIIQSK